MTLAEILLGLSIILLLFIIVLDSPIVLYLTVIAVVIEIVAGVVFIVEFFKSYEASSWLNRRQSFDQNCLNAYRKTSQELKSLSELKSIADHPELQADILSCRTYLDKLREERYGMNVKFLGLLDRLASNCTGISSNSVLTLQERSLLAKMSTAFSEVRGVLKEMYTKTTLNETVDMNEALLALKKKFASQGLLKKGLGDKH